MTGRLQDKIAIVTGASRGIGAAIARSFAAEGARLVLVSRKREGLEEVRDRIEADGLGTHAVFPCHVGKREELEELVSFCRAELGVVNVLVNNAATNPYFGPLSGIDESRWDKTFEVNVKGPFELSRLVILGLQEAGLSGSIVHISSISGMQAAPLQGVYGMTKAALISMTQSWAFEIGASGIRMNCIAPGLVETRFASALVQNPEISKWYAEHTALKRHAQPDEIAGMAVYLASDESSFVTGMAFPVDGGFTVG